MTPQEQQMIDGLISRIRNTQVQSKDSAAEQHIQSGLAGFSDALYVLVQTVLVQQYGLEQATSQLSELKQQNGLLQDKLEEASQVAKNSGGGGSFLSHIFGSSSSQPPQLPSQPPSPAQYQPVNNPGYGAGYATGGYPPPPPSAYPPQGYPAPMGGGMFGGGGGGMFGGGGGGGGGFLQGALQTAAGVAAGEMVFQGMEDLFHGFGGHERGFGGGMGGGGGETVVNNYYDDDRGDGGRDAGDRNFGGSDRDDSGFYNPGNDASRDNFGDTTQGGSDAGGFGGGAMDFTGDDSGSNDSSSFDNSGGDDFSGSGDNS